MFFGGIAFSGELVNGLKIALYYIMTGKIGYLILLFYVIKNREFKLIHV